MENIIMLILGVFISVMGIVNIKGNISTIHSYNRRRVKEEDIPRIFDRFYRVEDSRNTKDNGVGLGLAITKNFVLALEGKIRVKSNLGFGGEFNVVFEKNNRMNNDKKKDKHL